MAKYRVCFTKWSRSYSDVYMTVEADNPAAAYDRVAAIQNGDVDPETEEEESEAWGKERLDDSGFECMNEPTDYGTVCEVIESVHSHELRSCHEAFKPAATPIE